MEPPTSSASTPTEPSSVKTAEAKPEFKEEDGLKVDKRSKQQFLMSVGLIENHATAMKCSGCQMLTSHSLVEVTMYRYGLPDKATKRLVGCQNCGKLSSK